LMSLVVAVTHSTPVHDSALASKIIASEPTVLCNLEYSTTWYTDYKEIETEECHTEYDKICTKEVNVVCVDSSVTKCDLVTNTVCHTEYSQQCKDHVKLELEPYIETVCETKYQEECEHRWEGEGNEKIWVPILGTCRQEPYEECADLAKTKERQVTYPVCEDVPHQVCVDVPKEVCHEIPEKKCAEKPYEKCADVPREECIKVHRKIPVKASKKIPKQKCIHTDGHQEAGPYQKPAKPLPFNPVPPVAPGPPLQPPVAPVTRPVTVNSPKFVSVPAVPAGSPVPALPLPQFTGFVRLGKSADIGEEESEEVTTIISQIDETQTS